MKRLWTLSLLAALVIFGAAVGFSKERAVAASTPAAWQAQQAPQAAPTISAVIDREISNAEKEIVAAAEAMPEDKFDFSPESLKISGSDYKGVRTFAQQVKHIATSNYFIWTPITGDKLPEGLDGDNAPANLKSKAEIVKYLKESFALGHKAAGTLTADNMLQPAGKSKASRLRLATFGVSHAFDHYGANGGIPAHERHRSTGEPQPNGMTGGSALSDRSGEHALLT